jgi:hypothetical protein
MHSEDNSHAGQGPVLLDIGGDVGALVVEMPAALVGTEIEIRPIGTSHSHLEHVGVVDRPVNGRANYTAVFGELAQGRYELYQRPNGPVQLRVEINGGTVAQATWPA